MKELFYNEMAKSIDDDGVMVRVRVITVDTMEVSITFEDVEIHGYTRLVINTKLSREQACKHTKLIMEQLITQFKEDEKLNNDIID